MFKRRQDQLPLPTFPTPVDVAKTQLKLARCPEEADAAFAAYLAETQATQPPTVPSMGQFTVGHEATISDDFDLPPVA